MLGPNGFHGKLVKKSFKESRKAFTNSPAHFKPYFEVLPKESAPNYINYASKDLLGESGLHEIGLEHLPLHHLPGQLPVDGVKGLEELAPPGVSIRVLGGHDPGPELVIIGPLVRVQDVCKPSSKSKKA